MKNIKKARKSQYISEIEGLFRKLPNQRKCYDKPCPYLMFDI